MHSVFRINVCDIISGQCKSSLVGVVVQDSFQVRRQISDSQTVIRANDRCAVVFVWVVIVKSDVSSARDLNDYAIERSGRIGAIDRAYISANLIELSLDSIRDDDVKCFGGVVVRSSSEDHSRNIKSMHCCPVHESAIEISARIGEKPLVCGIVGIVLCIIKVTCVVFRRVICVAILLVDIGDVRVGL